ncbi:MAG: response regulator transcription factor [Thermodesulfovibrionales bacterium]|jgi:DNA-binding NarL/FixJ family response regulator
MIRVIVADDHIIFRQGLLKLLQFAEGITVVGETGEGKEALAMVVKESPDIAVLDISMPGLSGIEIAQELQVRGSGAKVICLTMHNDVLTAKKALTFGVSGYILKDDAFEDLLYAIKAVASGRKFISPSISDKILHSSHLKVVEKNILTEREREILKLIASGLTNKKIADKLSISVKTVETHRSRILQKLDFHTTAELVKYAIKTGLLE